MIVKTIWTYESLQNYILHSHVNFSFSSKYTLPSKDKSCIQCTINGDYNDWVLINWCIIDVYFLTYRYQNHLMPFFPFTLEISFSIECVKFWLHFLFFPLILSFRRIIRWEWQSKISQACLNIIQSLFSHIHLTFSHTCLCEKLLNKKLQTETESWPS